MPSPNTERGEHDRGEQKAEQDRQRQTDPEKSFREAHIAAHDSEICVGGVGEQHHGERQFGQKAQSFAAYVDAQQAQPIGAEDKANHREHDRAADQGPLDPAADRAVDQKKGGEEGGILVHSGQISHE